jgi:hypothetical protein
MIYSFDLNFSIKQVNKKTVPKIHTISAVSEESPIFLNFKKRDSLSFDTQYGGFHPITHST